MKLLVILTLFYSANVFSWGKTGHRIVGELASLHLTEKAKREVKVLIGNETLAHVSIWPDRIKSDSEMRKRYSKYHYISVPKKKTVDEMAHSKGKHIISGLNKFVATLKNKKAPKAERVIALKFIVHLIGDLHQPLHVGYIGDQGGNKLKVQWFGKKTNLHAIWDESLIDMEELSFTEYTKMLNFYTDIEKKGLAKGSFVDWAKESRALLKPAYAFKESKYWEYNYSFKHIGTVNKRLRAAGYRLAHILNNYLVQ